MSRVLPPAELIPASEAPPIVVPDTPAGHRLIDLIRDMVASAETTP